MNDLVSELKGEIGNSEKCVYVPLYQRNYRWNPGGTVYENNTARKLIYDIINKYNENKEVDYNLGMLTTHTDADKGIQILDGQQRLITLSLIMKAIRELGKTECIEGWIDLKFERDGENWKQGGDRYNYINNNQNEKGSVDVKRMAANYAAICDVLKNNKSISPDKLFKYIMEHVKMLRHDTKREPIDEFLNMNFKRTPFCAADKIKAHMIFDSVTDVASANSENKAPRDIKEKDIMELWKKIQYTLYQQNNVIESNDQLENDMFQLIKNHYEHYQKNRMEVLFEGEYRYYSNTNQTVDISNYTSDDGNNRKTKLLTEYKILEKDYIILKSLLEELTIKVDGGLRPNYTAYSAYYLLCQKNPDIRFFDLFKDIISIENDGIKAIYDEYDKFNLTRESYTKLKDKYANVNQFMQSMLVSGKITDEKINGRIINDSYIDELKIKDWNKIRTDYDAFEEYKILFEERLSEYASMLDYGKKISNDLPQKITLRGLLYSPDIRYIKIPLVQREYVMGNAYDVGTRKYLEDFLLRIVLDELGVKSEEMISNIIKKKATEIWHHNETIQSKTRDLLDNGIVGLCNNDRHYMCLREVNYSNNKRYIYKTVIEEIDEFWKKLDGEKYVIDPDKGYKMNGSCIMGHLDDNGTFWVYDGQQRLTTIMILLAAIISEIKDDQKNNINELKKNMLKYSFQGREGANKILGNMIENLNDNQNDNLKMFIEDSTSYSIYALWSELKSDKPKKYGKIHTNGDWNDASNLESNLESIKKSELSNLAYSWKNTYAKLDPNFILDRIEFDLVCMDEIEDAEQLFIEINEGVQLSPAEEYKAKLIHSMREIGYTKIDEFARKMDNEWLIDSEDLEIKYIKYALTSAYYELNPNKKNYDPDDPGETLEGLDGNVLDLVLECFNVFLSNINEIKVDFSDNKYWIYSLSPDRNSEANYHSIRISNDDMVTLYDNFDEIKNNCFDLIHAMRIGSLLKFCKSKKRYWHCSRNTPEIISDKVGAILLCWHDKYNSHNRLQYLRNNSGSQEENYLETAKENEIDAFLSQRKCLTQVSEKDMRTDIEIPNGIQSQIMDQIKDQIKEQIKELLKNQSGKFIDLCAHYCVHTKEIINNIHVIVVFSENKDDGKLNQACNDFEDLISMCVNYCEENTNKIKNIQLIVESSHSEKTQNSKQKQIEDYVCYESMINYLELKENYLSKIIDYLLFYGDLFSFSSMMQDTNLKKYLEEQNIDTILEQYKAEEKDLLYVLKNCRKGNEEAVQKKIYKTYIASPDDHEEYIYQTREYLKIKYNSKDNSSVWKTIKNDILKRIEIKDAPEEKANYYRILTEEMAKDMGIEKEWCAQSGIYSTNFVDI